MGSTMIKVVLKVSLTEKQLVWIFRLILLAVLLIR